jgi:hypothetical protein
MVSGARWLGVAGKLNFLKKRRFFGLKVFDFF